MSTGLLIPTLKFPSMVSCWVSLNLHRSTIWITQGFGCSFLSLHPGVQALVCGVDPGSFGMCHIRSSNIPLCPKRGPRVTENPKRCFFCIGYWGLDLGVWRNDDPCCGHAVHLQGSKSRLLLTVD